MVTGVVEMQLARQPVAQTGRKLLHYSNAVRFSSRAENWSLIDSLASLIILLLNDALRPVTQALRLQRQRAERLLSDGGRILSPVSKHHAVKTYRGRES